MDKKKLIFGLYLIICIAACFIIIGLNLKAQNLLTTATETEILNAAFQKLQKQISYAGILFFIPMLIISLVWYYITSSRTLILLSNILYISTTLFVAYTLNKEFHELNNAIALETVGFWLFAMIGLFSIIGSILVSTIGYITIRNLTGRTNQKNKTQRFKINR
jgi:hypothetical protein